MQEPNAQERTCDAALRRGRNEICCQGEPEPCAVHGALDHSDHRAPQREQHGCRALNGDQPRSSRDFLGATQTTAPDAFTMGVHFRISASMKAPYAVGLSAAGSAPTARTAA